MKIWGDRCGKVDFIFSVFLPAFQRRCDQPRGHGLKIMSSSGQVQIIRRYSPGSFSVLISTIFSVNVAFSFLQLIKHNRFNLSKIYFPIANKFLISSFYLYFIKVESLAKELAAREISVSTMGLTT